VRVVSAVPRRLQRRDTYVVVASRAPLGLPAGPLEGPGGERAVVVPPAEVEALVRRTGARILTDDDAPVENLLAPVLHD